MGRGMNPHKMKRMMKQLGINIEELDNVDKIIIRTADKEYVFDDDVAVTIMTTQGQKTYQIVGNPTVRDRGTEEEGSEEDVGVLDAEEEPRAIPQEDIELVCQQTGVSEEEAKAALEACDGNPAEAILKLMEN
ncbi:nascent polypeptide-associated complex protein [[Eubacterium] cellulosolvens]